MTSDTIYREIVRGWSEEEMELFHVEQFHFSPETGSTNDDLLQRARTGTLARGTVHCSDFQTRGRGRRGDRWETASGRNLLFSLALPLDGDRRRWPRLPHLTAWIVGSTIESVLPPGERLQTKWPNDLLYQGKKLAGILVETILTPQPFAVVGIGLNVNQRPDEFPESLQSLATSLYAILGCESSRWFLLGQILRGFLHHYPEKLESFAPVLDWIRPRDFLAGKSLSIRSGRSWLDGVGDGVAENGALRLDTLTEGIVEIVSAEEIRRR